VRFPTEYDEIIEQYPADDVLPQTQAAVLMRVVPAAR